MASFLSQERIHIVAYCRILLRVLLGVLHSLQNMDEPTPPETTPTPQSVSP
ncbi:MAG: hypothetical protein JWN98_33 [Abditibacteriota bacterium]|jgi:hypothetical protein|nr:hypothetical protein [Abditibacteriota bacterium]